MVCLGNICRSPLAEGILHEKITRFGLLAQVDSAGTGNYHEGESADPRSVAVAHKNNVNITHHTARQFRQSDFDTYNLIYVMDDLNFEHIIEKARNENDRAKVKMLMNELLPDENINVPDPYFGGKNGFDNVYEMIDRACDRIVKKMLT